MVYLSESPRFRLLTLCLLYVCQGIPYGFLHTALKPHLAERGVSLTEMADLIFMATLPWIFKFLYGPFVDSYGIRSMGRRRPWILIAQLGMGVTMASMMTISEPHLHLAFLGWMLFAHNVFGSLQDVSVDALAVDLLNDRERGIANGLMFGSSVAGNSASGFLIGIVIGAAGFPIAAGVQAAIIAIVFLIPLLALERPGDQRFPSRQVKKRDDAATRSPRDVFRDLWKALSLKSALIGIVLAISAFVGYDAFTTAEDNFLVQELGWKREDVQVLKAAFLWLTVLGCFLGGLMADRFGPRRIIAISTILIGTLFIIFGLTNTMWSTGGYVAGFLAVGSLVIGFLNVSLFSLFMKISWPVIAATQFTSYMSLLNLSKAGGAQTAKLQPVLDSWPLFFIIVGVIQMAVALILIPIDTNQTRRVLGQQIPPIDSDPA